MTSEDSTTALRCVSSLKSKVTFPRWPSSSVVRNFFVAATTAAVGLPGVELSWAKLLSPKPRPDNKVSSSTILLFTSKSKHTRSDESTHATLHRASLGGLLTETTRFRRGARWLRSGRG